MATGEVNVHIVKKFSRLPELQAAFPREVSAILRKTTFDIYAESQITVPVRKDQRKVKGGNLKNSGQVDYDAGSKEGTVTYSTSYVVYVHEGTRYMPARPFLKNAYDDKVRVMIQAFKSLERRLL